MWYNRTMKSDAQKQAEMRYRQKTYDQILVTLRKDSNLTREDVKQYAQECKMSVNEYIIQAIKEKHDRE